MACMATFTGSASVYTFCTFSINNAPLALAVLPSLCFAYVFLSWKTFAAPTTLSLSLSHSHSLSTFTVVFQRPSLFAAFSEFFSVFTLSQAICLDLLLVSSAVSAQFPQYIIFNTLFFHFSFLSLLQYLRGREGVHNMGN